MPDDVIRAEGLTKVFNKGPVTKLVVETKNLKKTYTLGKVPVNALQGVNLKVEKGDFLAILGPSGSGKSTLLNMIGALDKPTEGKVFIEGVDVSTLTMDWRI